MKIEKKVVKLHCGEYIEENNVILLKNCRKEAKFSFETFMHVIQRNNKINIITTNNTRKRIKLNKGMKTEKTEYKQKY